MKQKEVMKLLNISRTTLWRYVDSGLIKTYGERHHRTYNKDSVMELYNKKLINNELRYKNNPTTLKHENPIYIKIDLFNGIEQSKVLNKFFENNRYGSTTENNYIRTIVTATLDITNEFDSKEFIKLYDNLTEFSKSKLKKIYGTYTSSKNKDISLVITNLQEKLLKNNCKLVILQKAQFRNNDNDSEVLEKNKIEIFDAL